MSLRQKWRLSIFPAGYALVLLMLSLAIWNPSIPLGPGPVDLMLLLDESDSITPARNDTVWQSFLQQSRRLPAGSRISLMRFADRASLEIPWISIHGPEFEKLARSEHPPRHRFLDQGATDIMSALRSAIRYTSPDRHTALLISSDGHDNVTAAESAFLASIKTSNTKPDIIKSNKNPNLSIYYLKSTDEQHQAALKIESINLPSISIPGQSLPLSIAVESVSGGRGTIEVSLNKRIVDKQSLVLQPGETQVLTLHLLSSSAGVQNLAFLLRDEHGNIIDQHNRVLASRNGRQLLYIGHQSFNSQARFLQLKGWQIVQLQAQDLPSDETFFSGFDIVLIDDLEAGLFNAEVTKNLIHAVELSATGLIVLGGPHSFGSGGYRHSELEAILPVTAEASRPLPGAAFLFLLDKSGSMEAASRSLSRLANALRAVSESAKSLRPGDESALLVFDREVDILLPLKNHPDPKAVLNQPWQLQPSGGTRLAPALEQAIKLLTNSEAKQRFLILVSDGFVDGENIPPLQIALREANIQLIALAIGNNADLSTLHKLAASSGGLVLQVNDTAQLPRFMRQQLETRQQSWNKTQVTPHTSHQLPFIGEQNSSWIQLHGHQITRSKSSARVYVATDEGDPLLAVGHYGTGKVAALPGGILETVSGENALNGLLTWMNSRQINPNLKISHRYLSGQLSLLVDAVDTDNRWLSTTTTELILTSPGGFTHSQPLEAVAPGRFEAVLPAPAVGAYSAKIKIGDEQALYTAYLADDREYRQSTNISAHWLKQSLSSGDIQHWTETSLQNLMDSSSGHWETRPLWLLLALISYLALIAIERSRGFHVLISSLCSLKFRKKS